jgi:hypothetical protein
MGPIDFFEDANDLKILNPTVYIGNIDMKKKYSTTFELKNFGDNPLIINSINSSCGCVIPKMDMTPLMPDSIRQIKIEIFATIRGEFSKSVTLKIKSKKNPYLRMWIHGNVQ